MAIDAYRLPAIGVERHDAEVLIRRVLAPREEKDKGNQQNKDKW
jgi:hypothetical protein